MASLSGEKIEAYLNHIGLPESARNLLNEGPTGGKALDAVTMLQQYHMARVPFDNLDLHYSDESSPPQQTEVVYNMVVQRKRGGVCNQVHQLFVLLLRSFGFRAYCTGGRLSAAASLAAAANVDKYNAEYGPWVHTATLVTICNQKYLVETNVGPAAPPYPVPLIHDEPAVDMWQCQRRLIHGAMPGWTSDAPVWRLQLREPDFEDWMDVCCFGEDEWIPLDFKMMIAGMANLGLTWFKARVVCFTILLEDEKPCGYLLMFHDEIRRKYKGKEALVQKLYCEEDRVSGLKEYFGIEISREQRKCILGTVAELKDDTHDFYG